MLNHLNQVSGDEESERHESEILEEEDPDSEEEL